MNTRYTIRQISVEAVESSVEAIREFPRAVISAEEKLRRRLQAVLRVALATSFIWLSGLFSIGIQVTSAVAKSISKDAPANERRVHKSTRHKQHYKFNKNGDAPAIEGTASWYGHQFHNRKTASGKKFDKNSLMAAHRSLPFGTMVRVVNLENNRSCIVEITDRGPYAHHRIIDVSEAAAKELDFTSNGTARVRLEVLSPNIAQSGTLRTPTFISDALRGPVSSLGIALSAR